MLGFLRKKIRSMIMRELQSGELRILVARLLRSVGKDVLTELLTDEEEIATKAAEYARRVFAGKVDPNPGCILGYEKHDVPEGSSICDRCGHEIPETPRAV